ncbi:MAG: hypothetical protein DSZ05_04430 [Sulfurospirillum sp.]|nr:MAG: hypothetical protein DSZ05_04430 [Sulfurospirillum sp.]
MAEKFFYKFISLIIALGIYIAVLLGIYYAVYGAQKEKKDYGYSVEDAIVVNIDTLLKEKPKPIQKPQKKSPPHPKQPVQQHIIPSPVKEVVQKPEPVQSEQKPPKPEEVPPSEKKESRDKVAKSAKDLFSTVRTDKYKKAMEEKQKQREARASRLRKQEAEHARKRAQTRRKAREKARRKAARKAREAQKLLEELQMTQSSSKHLKRGERHEFWSFVSSKIMGKWNRTIATQDGIKGYATIRIDNRGNLTYKNLKLSGNSLFDTKLKVFLDNLEYERFPAYKDGPYIEAVFEFKDQVKGK